MHFDYHIGGQ